MCQDRPLLAGDASEMDHYSSFHVWKDMLATPVGKLMKKLVKKGGQDEVVRQFGPHVDVLNNVFAELALPENPKTLSLSGQARAEKLHKLMLELVARVAKPGTLLLFDSAQWLDNASWSLLSQICATLPGLLVCVMVRPLKSPPFDYNKIEKLPTTTQILLEPLRDPNSTAKLVSQWSALDDVPSAITDQIHKKAQGNPFVTQEMVQVCFFYCFRGFYSVGIQFHFFVVVVCFFHAKSIITTPPPPSLLINSL